MSSRAYDFWIAEQLQPDLRLSFDGAIGHARNNVFDPFTLPADEQAAWFEREREYRQRFQDQWQQQDEERQDEYLKQFGV